MGEIKSKINTINSIRPENKDFIELSSENKINSKIEETKKLKNEIESHKYKDLLSVEDKFSYWKIKIKKNVGITYDGKVIDLNKLYFFKTNESESDFIDKFYLPSSDLDTQNNQNNQDNQDNQKNTSIQNSSYSKANKNGINTITDTN